MKNYVKNVFSLLLFSLTFLGLSFPQDYRIIKSDNSQLVLEFDFKNKFEINDFVLDGIKFTNVNDNQYPLRNSGEPFLPTRFYEVGIPLNSNAEVSIQESEREVYTDKFIIATPDSSNQPLDKLNYNQEIYGTNSVFPSNIAEVNSEATFRYIKTASLSISPFQFNPVERTLILNKKIVVKIEYKQDLNFKELIIPIADKMSEELIKTNVINSVQALGFLGKVKSLSDSPSDNYWYNPNKDYYKIYLNSKAVYRITCDFLISQGVPANALENNQLELLNNGVSIPIDVVDINNNNLFDSGDYFQFVGEPAKPIDEYTRMNIYNKSNVYWFSYQADSVNYYRSIDGFPIAYSPLITSSIKTLRWEEDNTYQHFGRADDEFRDYWQWDQAEAQNRLPYHNFLYYIQDSIWDDFVVEKPQANIKVGLHGLTSISCGNGDGHNVNIKFNTKIIGTKSWDGQEAAFCENNFYLAYNTLAGGDTALLNYQTPQKFEVECNGNICDAVQNDIVLINYFELSYWAWNKTNSNYFYFTSPPNNYNDNRYYLWLWQRDNMKIYIPSRNELITNPDIKNDADHSVYFVDTISTQTDYYCVADDYYLLPDSIVQDSPSDLRNLTNGADYIIITNPLFESAAQRLAEYRSSNLKGYAAPRVKVVNITDIYDEFSYGLLDPWSLQKFAKYAFNNWQLPTPVYIVLMGDMSFDYRKINPTSRDNYIPSIPYHAPTYGQAASDNNIVTVAGNDLVPDMAIGRISCETLDEANILVDKIINYPADLEKEWKQNVLLLSSGLSAADEDNLKFNDKNMFLANDIVDPNGFKSTKIFRYPNKPEYIQYQGEGPDIRREINNGAAIVNYYGHGGGYQWDLVFTDDDILALNNGARLPFVISVTCYTAHFDNQEVFGEIFNSIPGKGSIAFFGSSGVTFWPTTAIFNQDLFYNIFNNENYVIGDAILSAKSNPNYSTMLALLTLLGDPALELALPYSADFVIKPSLISIEPINPLINDTVKVKIKINNVGRAFIGDSVKVELFYSIISDTTIIGAKKLGSFGETDSTFFDWIPIEDGSTNLIVVVNRDEMIEEVDHSDNKAEQIFSVFSVDKPKILKPVNNFFSSKNSMDFIIIDVGNFVQQNFSYQIILDSSRNLNSSFKLISPILYPTKDLVKWSTPQLNAGEYFYEVYIYSASDTNKSQLSTFSISENSGSGFLAKSNQLLDFNTKNINYSDQTNSLILNTMPLPPRPSKDKLIDSIYISVPLDSTEITTCTTDGTYLYFGQLSYYAEGNKSKIYKVGTGFNGTVKGNYYGTVGDISVDLKNQMFYANDGYLYAATGDDSTLLKVNISSGDTTRVNIPSKLLPSEDGLLHNGGFYIASDGFYVYNLSAGYGNFRNRHILRILDPANNWNKIGEDIILLGSSEFGFSGFFVSNGYLFTYESYQSGYMRRYRISDGYFEEEFAVNYGSIDIYTWTYDWINNFIYAGLFRPNNFNYNFGFYKFIGTYVESSGSLTSPDIGPARSWKNLNFNLENTGSSGYTTNLLLGKNSLTQAWDTLNTNIPSSFTLNSINPDQYPYLKMQFNLVDSTLGISEPMKFKSLQLDYDYFPEINMYPDEVYFDSDSLLQGFPVEMSLKVDNIGYTQADSLRLDFYHNLLDTAFYTTFVNVPGDSFVTVNKSINTSDLLYSAPVSPINVNVVATSPVKEYYTFNNSSNGHFNVVRDSANPIFNITFNGREIINGDIISSEPEVVITLEDNSPLPLDSTDFTLVHTFNNIPRVLTVPGPDITFEQTPYPNNKVVITWKPKLEDGRHVLEVLAKDASGNFFDSTSSRSVFNVYNNPDLLQVFNYPNPFSDNTYFTFELRGVIPPEEFKIKIFTVAGRLIREMIPSSPLQIGFNKIYWDGRDEDGDEIANGLYFYKIISKNNGEVKTVTQKLAKIK